MQEPLIDIGCGEGRLLRDLDGVSAFGCDISRELLSRAAKEAPVVRARLPNLRWLRSGSMATAAAVFVIEHLRDAGMFFSEVARIVKSDGIFVLVMNHPAYTSDQAGPLVDVSDGEVLWRWGAYFDEGSSSEPAGADSVVFYHRPLSALLNNAASNGFSLEKLVEAPLGLPSVSRDPGFVGQEHFPRILGTRWRRR